ncbi:hypothetical protein SISSUDRAFT_916073 [Sistotremastrum suecicum HHB10207 ss-3]|uniref:Uncharacterized protein n=1 Tax=Sistotremastrum suecicum HHB10207 ss-3 TaxID=1314776 RepID=A0A166BZX9_9AGAM|nr:hypothetical protein SISSUDRAFT_916073 [Sistotremastrum suecicum HHB10207 ss-3]
MLFHSFSHRRSTLVQTRSLNVLRRSGSGRSIDQASRSLCSRSMSDRRASPNSKARHPSPPESSPLFPIARNSIQSAQIAKTFIK